MSYGFYYLDDSIIYMQTGLNSKKEAKLKLEEIAFIYKKNATGLIREKEKNKIRTIKEYRILYKDGKIKIRQIGHNL